MNTTGLAELTQQLWSHVTDQSAGVDDEYTELLLNTVLACVNEDGREGYPTTLRAFVIMHHDELADLVRTFGPGSSFDQPTYLSRPYELAYLPAILALCERLTVTPMRLQAVWRDQFESETPLEDLGRAWGY